ncbi:GNAT family N-acetyltransferase [Pedobacter insulae]|uniref:Protein N-acetyltransferase, RimJ/RimL family n=1 Tax=Pedobacter insulae TaxID=414048 RepID=A0A1I2TNA8_9SPHI|nr:GNAT family N-acetyltransferase [Pedobacter insulae]SFG64827.1 Protein N-acetyltransferase, RimJ/RimL family [Pedobacter insulae]
MKTEKYFDLQPTLANELVKLVPLKKTDFEALFAVASDPLIWEQHPNRDRYKRKVLEKFFEGAMESKGGFIIYEADSDTVIGSTRYYDKDANAIAIGYTFIGRKYWGKGYNAAIKNLMFDYAFQYVDKIILHIGATNFRSQKAAEKIGATKTGEINVAYYGEPVKLNFVYEVNRNE